MHRLSIRLQILVQAGLLLFAFTVVSGFAWWIQRGIVYDFDVALDISAQTSEIAHFKQGLVDAEINLMRFASGLDNSVDATRATMTGLGENMAEITRTFETPRVDASVDVENSQKLNAIAEQVAALGTQIDEFATMDGAARQTFLAQILLPTLIGSIKQIEEIEDLKAETVAALESEVAFLALESEIMLVGAIVACIILGCLLSIIMGGSLAKAIHRATKNIDRLARQDYNVDSLDITRGDEMGKIAASVLELRDKLKDADQQAEASEHDNALRVDLFAALGQSMKALEQGRLTAKMATEDWEELGPDATKLCEDFNKLVASLADVVSSLSLSSDTVQQNATELSEMSTDMSRRAETQAATLEESAAALDELSESVRAAATRAQEADTMVIEGRRRAEEGGRVMGLALNAMGSIAESSEKIERIIAVIDDIAFQTNLLALNAGVEAARAGSSGKGFAVVASEVRTLAQRAAESASEIKDLVANSTAQVADGERLVQETSITLGKIVESVTDVSGVVSNIASSAKEQAAGVEEINVGVTELDRVTQQNAAMVNQASEASVHMTAEAARLADLLVRFGGPNSPPETQEIPVQDHSDMGGGDVFFEDTSPTTTPSGDATDTGIVNSAAQSATSEDQPATKPSSREGDWANERQVEAPKRQASNYKVAVGDDVEWTDF